MAIDKARAKLFQDAAAGKPDVQAAVAAGLPQHEAMGIAEYYSKFHGTPTIPKSLQPEPQPTYTAPQQTPATSFREGVDDFGTAAGGAITRGYDEEIAGWLGTLQGHPFEQGVAEQKGRKAAADERSPGASMGGSIAGSFLAPGGTAGDVAASGLRAAITPGSAGSMLQDMLVAGTLSRLGKTGKTGRTTGVAPAQIISARNMRRPHAVEVESALGHARDADKARRQIKRADAAGNTADPALIEAARGQNMEHLSDHPDAGTLGVDPDYPQGYVVPRGAPEPPKVYPPTQTIDDPAEIIKWGEMKRQEQIARQAHVITPGPKWGKMPAFAVPAAKTLEERLREMGVL